MVNRKWSALICAIITLVVGVMFDEAIFKPLIQGINNNLPCPTNEKWLGTCLNLKTILSVSPYMFTFAGIFGVIRVVFGDDD